MNRIRCGAEAVGIVVLMVVLAQASAAVGQYAEGSGAPVAERLSCPPCQPGDASGIRVAMSGKRIVVGSYYGEAADVFAERSGEWTHETRLTSAGVPRGAWFGFSAAVEGDTALVSALLEDGAGAVHVFERSRASWTETAKIPAPPGAWNFGVSMALMKSADVAIIGAYKATVGGRSEQGAVYVYRLHDEGWVLEQTLTAGDGAAGDYFGIHIALSDTTLAVGADYKNEVRGAVYVFELERDTWVEAAKLTAPDAQPWDALGASVDIDGKRIVAGAVYRGPGGAGAAYVFHKVHGSWIHEATLTAADPQYALGGMGVAIEGTTVVMGAPHAGGTGRAYQFTRKGGEWVQTQAWQAEDGLEGDFFGQSVAIDRNTVVVGAPATDHPERTGGAYVFSVKPAKQQ